jgi:hypothetical protein
MLPPTVILNAPNLLCATTRGFEDVPTDGYLIDSAATTHISHSLSHFHNYGQTPIPPNREDSVATGAGPLKVSGYGTTVKVYDNHHFTLELHNVMHVPECPANILSIPKVHSEGYTLKSTSAQTTLQISGDQRYLTTKNYKGIFYMTWLPDRFHAAMASVSSSTAASL